MKYLKKFEKFTNESVAADPAVKPSEPKTKPGTKPGTRPQRPSPIRRDKPSVTPDPKAEKEMPKATAKEVADRFIELAMEEGMDLKKYFNK